MNREQIKAFVRIFGKSVHISKRKGWAQIPCPLAPYRHEKGTDSNPSFGIKIDTSKPSRTFCFSCGFSGTPLDLVFKMMDLAGRDAGYDYLKAVKMAEQDEEGTGLALAYYDEDEEREEFTHYFSETWLDEFPDCTKAKDGLSYVLGRGVPKWVVQELGMKYDPIERRVCFPVRDSAGDLVGLHGRGIDNTVLPPYRMYTYPRKNGNNNPIYWYGEEWADLEKPLVLVESVFDLTSVYRVYKNVVCPLTATLNRNKIQRLEDALYLILMFDADKAGRKAEYKIKKQLPHIRCKSIRLAEGDDPGDLSVSEIKELILPLTTNLLTA